MDPFPPGHGLVASLSFANGQWLWVSVGCAAAGLLLLAFSYARSPLQGPVKWLALSLKALGLVLLALSLMEPVLVDEFPKKGANDLVLLADNSRGLAVQPPDGGEALGAEMLAALRADRGGAGDGEADEAGDAVASTAPPAWLTALADRYRLRNYVFDRRLERSDDFAELDLSGEASNLLTSLRSLRARYARQPLAAAVVFTDGNATDLDSLAEVVEEWTASGEEGERVPPLFPVVVGREVTGADLAIEAVTPSQSAFEDAPLQLTAQVTARGDSDQAAEVFAIDSKGEEVASESVLFPGDAESEELRRETVRLRVAAVPPGVSFYRVGVRIAGKSKEETGDKLTPSGDPPPAEITLENNSRLVAVDRGRGPFRVLYVSGRPNWEYKFLRRALAGDAELELVSLIRIARREPKFEWRGRGGGSRNPLFRGFESDIPEETQDYDDPVLIRLNTADEKELRDGFPKTGEELFPRYRAVILDDIEAGFFTVEQQHLLDRFVAQRGGTVVMLGGQESFQKGGWKDTPVGRFLPVYLDDLGRGKEEPPALDAAWQLTREGWLEPWTRLREKREEEEIRFAHMPGFQAVNRLSAIKPGARLLATVSDPEGRTLPALVTQRYGEGRAATLAIADLWRWGMKDAEHQEDMAKAWRQFLRWAVVDAPGRVRIETRTRAEGTLPMREVAVRVKDEEFRPQDDASVRMEVERVAEHSSHSSHKSHANGVDGDHGAEKEKDKEKESLDSDTMVESGEQALGAPTSSSASADDKAPGAPIPSLAPADDRQEQEVQAQPSLEVAGEFTGRHFSEEAGGYRVTAEVRDGEGELIDEVEAGWATNPAADEFRHLGPDRAPLEQLAEATGGQVLTLSQTGRLPALLADMEAPVMERQQRPLWHTPWLFLLALGCFVGEWALRRGKGIL